MSDTSLTNTLFFYIKITTPERDAQLHLSSRALLAQTLCEQELITAEMSRLHVRKDQQPCTKYQCHLEVTGLCNHCSSPVLWLLVLITLTSFIMSQMHKIDSSTAKKQVRYKVSVVQVKC